MIEVYTIKTCPFCHRAKALLDQKGCEYQEIDVTDDAELRMEAVQRSGRRTVPQIFVDGESVGGYDDLARLDQMGELDRILLEVSRAG